MSYSNIDALIKKGSLKLASKALRDKKQISTMRPVQLAELFRRTGDYFSALKVLRKNIFERGELKQKPHDADIVEYSTSLVQFGLISQAKVLMERVQQKSYSWFQLNGFMSLQKLEYNEALGHFNKAYLAKDATAYQRLIARVNMTNAMLGTFEFTDVITLADQILKDLDALQYGFLEKYLNHIKAQAYAFTFNKNEFEKHSNLVFKNSQINKLEDINSADEFEFIRGLFVCECILGLKHRFSKEKIMKLAWNLHEYHALNEFKIMSEFNYKKTEALEINQFNRTGQFLKKRYEFFKKTKWKNQDSVSITHSAFVFEDAFKNTENKFEYKMNTKLGHLKPGQIPIDIFELMIKNPMKCFSVYEVYENVYSSNKYFDPLRSPNLIHQAIRRLNTILSTEGFPIEVRSRNDRYQLVPTNQFNIRVKLDFSNSDAFVKMCELEFGHNKFRTVEASSALKLTARQVQNLIRQNESHFEKNKIGRNILYRLKA